MVNGRGHISLGLLPGVLRQQEVFIGHYIIRHLARKNILISSHTCSYEYRTAVFALAINNIYSPSNINSYWLSKYSIQMQLIEISLQPAETTKEAK